MKNSTVKILQVDSIVLWKPTCPRNVSMGLVEGLICRHMGRGHVGLGCRPDLVLREPNEEDGHLSNQNTTGNLPRARMACIRFCGSCVDVLDIVKTT